MNVPQHQYRWKSDAKNKKGEWAPASRKEQSTKNDMVQSVPVLLYILYFYCIVSSYCNTLCNVKCNNSISYQSCIVINQNHAIMASEINKFSHTPIRKERWSRHVEKIELTRRVFASVRSCKICEGVFVIVPGGKRVKSYFVVFAQNNLINSSITQFYFHWEKDQISFSQP